MKSKIEGEKDKILTLLGEGKNFKELAKMYGYTRTDKFKMAAIKCGIIPDKNGEYYKQPEYKCHYCGKVFESPQKLAGHINFCKDGPYRKKSLNSLEKNRANIDYDGTIKNDYFVCKFCGKQVRRAGNLVLHERSCQKNPNRVPREVTGQGKSHPAWNRGKTALDDYRIMRGAINRAKTIKTENYDREKLKHEHTEKTKRILREKMISYIKENNYGSFGQHYSKKGCEYIDKLNEEMGWNLKHALNGGEYEVCGYFLDGYDEKLNIAFEYDEPRHYENVYENRLLKKDVERQNEIKDFLHCEFYRYNEKIGLLYKV